MWSTIYSIWSTMRRLGYAGCSESRSLVVRALLVDVGVLLLLGVAATMFGAAMVPAASASAIPVRFSNYLQAGLPEQDVFVESGGLPEAVSANITPTSRPHKPHV